MGTLLYFAVFAGFFFMMMRGGCGAHVTGHSGHSHEGRDGEPDDAHHQWAPPETDIDPVCGMSVKTEGAKSSVYRGTVYYFCSAEHRDAFEADPKRYAGSTSGAGHESMGIHHG
jgi:YHS domain-containing protein